MNLGIARLVPQAISRLGRANLLEITSTHDYDLIFVVAPIESIKVVD